MAGLIKPDICVIGAGSGGLSVAAAAAAFGVHVVLVEKARMGGDCLNHGCVPSKALIAAASAAQAMREAGRFGIAPVEPDVDFRKVVRHVQSVIAHIAPNDSVERFTALGVHVIRAAGSFADRRTLVAGDWHIRARRFVVATGSSPAIPAIAGLDSVPYFTNETIFAETKLPADLAIIGAGPIGLELAQAFRRLGSQVTVLDSGAGLKREDPELAAVALRALAAEGVVLQDNARIARVERRGRSAILIHGERAGASFTVQCSHLLVAAGRRPNIDGLALDKAGVRTNDRGIATGPSLRTSNRRIYAVGDVAGQGQFTHLANYHAGLVLRPLLFRLKARAEPRLVPRVTYMSPEIAQVGMTEAEARAAGSRFSVLRWPFAENDRAQTGRATEGHIKIIAGRRGRILGVGIVGEGAGELIDTWSLAIAGGLTLRQMTAHVVAYPTRSEIGKRAAISYFAGATGNPWVRRLVRWLSRLG